MTPLAASYTPSVLPLMTRAASQCAHGLRQFAHSVAVLFLFDRLVRAVIQGSKEEAVIATMDSAGVQTTVASVLCTGLKGASAIASLASAELKIATVVASRAFLTANLFFSWGINVAVGLSELTHLVILFRFLGKSDDEIREMAQNGNVALLRRLSAEWVQKILLEKQIPLNQLDPIVMRHQVAKKILTHVIGLLSCLVGIAGLCFGGHLILLITGVLSILIWIGRHLVNKHYVTAISFDQKDDIEKCHKRTQHQMSQYITPQLVKDFAHFGVALGKPSLSPPRLPESPTSPNSTSPNAFQAPSTVLG